MHQKQLKTQGRDNELSKTKIKTEMPMQTQLLPLDNKGREVVKLTLQLQLFQQNPNEPINLK